MGLYFVKPDPLSLERACERSSVISLLTDCDSEDHIPSALRDASDRIERTHLSILRDHEMTAGSDAVFLWLEGEKLLEGSAEGLRRAVVSSGGRSFVPVHMPCFDEVELIGLQPRIWKRDAGPDATQPDLRIAAGDKPSPAMKGWLEKCREPWARLYSALLADQKEPGAGIDRLSQLWRDSSLIPKPYASLLTRNLIALLMRHKRIEEAEKLLKLGMDYFPNYAELPYLSALLCAARERFGEIPGYVRQATQNADLSYVGSGGENSYRSLWLLGWACEVSGKQEMAAKCYLAGLQARPAYPPSVFGILRQRLPYETVQHLRYQGLGSLPHREPQYLEPVFEYFLLHRQIKAARYVLESTATVDDTRNRLQRELDAAVATQRSAPGAGVKPSVMLVGPFYVHSSLGRINREAAGSLLAGNEFDVALEPQGFGEIPPAGLPHFDAIAKGLRQKVRWQNLTIRHHWPPNFERPESGKLVVIVPWEYGSIPIRWAGQINESVDELWVPSDFCRQVFVRGGVPLEKVRVIPNGIDPEIFNTSGEAWRPEGCRSCVFLFVGGAIRRKGIDVLWNAYRRAFTNSDDVTLVIKDIGSSTFLYKDMSLIEKLSCEVHDWRSPHCMILTEGLDDSKLASLYLGSNAVVLPYRGEGFGMPLAEGLSCGRPVITTGLGPAREFCPPESSYFLSARECEISTGNLAYGPMSGPFTWFEPDEEELARTMRWIFEHPEESAQRGLAAAEKVRAALSWPRVTGLQGERIRCLVDS